MEEFVALSKEHEGPAFDLEGRRAALTAELKERPEKEKPWRKRDLERRVEEKLIQEVFAFLHASGKKRSALCLSGGGIRSATFGLGVIQGLAQKKLLGKFDYLSTVSGGGYLGSWLSAWLHHARDPKLPGHADSPAAAVAQVEQALSAKPLSPLDPEPEPVRHLRGHSRYMSPQLGLVSVDT